MRKNLIFSSLLFLSCSHTAIRQVASEDGLNFPMTIANKIKAFSSDGCSSFPNGIPVADRELWLQCCVNHDVAYWQGGTEDQRNSADLELKSCVADKAWAVLAESMYMGVRMGGAPSTMMSWRWGYGWVLDNGYRKLSSFEEAQVAVEKEKIPADFKQIKIGKSDMNPYRQTLTGDYCIDQALTFLLGRLESPAQLLSLTSKTIDAPAGTHLYMKVTTDKCEQRPFQFDFLLSQAQSCKKIVTETSARLEVKLERVKSPEGCVK